MNMDTTWWSFDFDCNNTNISSYCQHCLYYNSTLNDMNTYECNIENLSQLFLTGIMETIVNLTNEEYCDIKVYFWYAMGGAGPLLLITLCLLFWICKQCCCNNKKNLNNNSNNPNHVNQSSGQLSVHHDHHDMKHDMQKETAYV